MRRLLTPLILALLATTAQARELSIGITQFPSNLHPNIDSMAAKSYVLGLTQRPFTVFDASWKLICMLCTELPTFENGRAIRVPQEGKGDGVALTFTIQPEARWGDGTPVTSADAVFTFEVGRHPQSGITNAELYRRILKLEAVDQKTFVMTVDRITFDYNGINDFRLVPAHLERPIFEADPATYRNRSLLETAPTTAGLAFGPYRIAEVVPGNRIRLVPNESWWGRKPAFDAITIKAIENTAALEANLLSGEVDMLEGSLGLALDQAIAFEKRHGSRFTVFYKPGLIYEHIDLMLDSPILRDRRIRQALLLATDRDLMIRQLFDGRQPIADSSVHPLDVMHDPSPTLRWPHDPAWAARLLDEAGWKPGPGGIRRNYLDEPLRIELMSTAGNRSRELVQQVLQSMWRKAGIEVTIRNEPPRVFFSETTAKRRFTGMALFAWISSPENVPRSTLHSAEIPSDANAWAGQNYTGFRNERMDALLDAIELELDPVARKKLWSELQAIYAQELPALPLYFRADAHIWPKWLKDVTPTGHMAPTTYWVENWRIETP